jgi:hypothetical protein
MKVRMALRVIQNSVNMTCMGLDRCQIMKYSGLSDNTYTDLSLLYNGYRVFPGGKGGRGVMLTTHPLLVPRLRKI